MATACCRDPVGWLFQRGSRLLLPPIPFPHGRGRASCGRARNVGRCLLYGRTLLKSKCLFQPELKLGSENGTPSWVPCGHLCCKTPEEGKTAETLALRPPETNVAALLRGTAEQ